MRYTIDSISEEIAPQGWSVLSEKYHNLDGELTFKCPEGHEIVTTWRKLRGSYKCPVCMQNSYAAGSQTSIQPKCGAHRVLALDQASHVTGYAIFDDGQLIKYGKFETSKSDEIARCIAIKHWLISMIDIWKPDFIGIEGIQYQDAASGTKMGITVFQTLARLQGILMETCYEANVEYQICPTNTWRHACGVKGRARVNRKRSMQLLVKQWYDVTVSDDEADAIGIGRYLVQEVMENKTIQNWET